MHPKEAQQPKLVANDIIQDAFNSGQFWERVQSGQLTERIVRNSHANPMRSGQPFCTRSQLVIYYSADDAIAWVHQYLRPDGSLGGSGRPDPKRLVIGDEILYTRSKSYSVELK